MSDDLPIVGVMYTAMTPDAPEGSAGPNDHWHRHSNVCLKLQNGMMTPAFPTDTDATKDQCDAVGGRFIEFTMWMVHAWVAPGPESPKGVFSHDNPSLHCPVGIDDTDSVGACLVQQLPIVPG